MARPQNCVIANCHVTIVVRHNTYMIYSNGIVYVGALILDFDIVLRCGILETAVSARASRQSRNDFFNISARDIF